MNSALAAFIGLALAIVLILRKVPAFFSLLVGALAGGLLSGWGMAATVNEMVAGVKDITPAILRILAAGVLSGVLVVSGAADSVARSIAAGLGAKRIYLALALSSMLLTAIGVFVDVAVITIAPIALMTGKRCGAPLSKLLLSMIGGGKCGNIISPNPNTLVAAENFGAALQNVMAAGLIPAIIGLVVTVWVVIPLMKDKKQVDVDEDIPLKPETSLPSFGASIAGPLFTVILLALRPLCGIVIDPLIALPAGGLVGVLATRSWRKLLPSLEYGLGKMSGVGVLLVGTGAVAGIIKASAIKQVLLDLLGGFMNGGTILAPVSAVLMSAATASSTAGATIASASFSEAILAGGVSAVWAASMVNAGSTVLDHLPHGSFFNATGGSVGMMVGQRLKLIPYETLIGLSLALSSFACCLLLG